MKRLRSRLRGASKRSRTPPAHGVAAEAPTVEDSARIATRPRWEEFEASELARGFELPGAERRAAPEGEIRVRLHPSGPRDLTELEVILGADETVVGLSLLLDRAALDTSREAASDGARLASSLLSFVAGADPVIGQLPAHLFAGTTDPLGALEAASRAGHEGRRGQQIRPCKPGRGAGARRPGADPGDRHLGTAPRRRRARERKWGQTARAVSGVRSA
jgi:hypothetical protein